MKAAEQKRHALHHLRLSAPILLFVSWALLDSARPLVPILGTDYATFLAFSACSTLALTTRPRLSPWNPKGRNGQPIYTFLSASIAGWAIGPALATAVMTIGLDWGWQPTQPNALSLIGWLNALLLAPLFEEILYRENLLVWLRARVPLAFALLLSSLAFALPHPGSFSRFAALLSGLILASTRSLTHSLWPCIGFHFGLNLFGVLAAETADGWIVSFRYGLPIGALALSVTVALERREPGGSK